MSSIKSYGKLNPLDQAHLEARRKTRRRLTIIGLSSSALIAMIIVVALVASRNRSSDDSNTDNNNNPSSFSTSIKAICDATLYPDSCISSLLPASNSIEFDPPKLFNLSVQVAVGGLSKVSKHLGELRAKANANNHTMTSLALDSCNELVELAIDHLNDCAVPSLDFGNGELRDDIKTWLSSAITHQHTCIDALNESAAELKPTVSDSIKNSTEFASNSLAIFGKLESMFASFNLRRRLMSYDSDRSTPSWLLSKDRRLLQSSTDPRTKADIVVAKDGSGKYKTIKAALKAVHDKSKKRTVIYVKKGVYYENVRVEKNKWNVMIVGDGKDRTIVSGGLNFVDGTPTFQSATFAAFGKGFIARDMGFKNSAGPEKHQAVALMSDSDHSVFYRCAFDAYQDTLYAHSQRQFYKECDIYGTVDFIFGNGAAVLQNCNIMPRVPTKGQQDTITAQGKVDPNQNTGISIHECSVRPFGNLTSVKVYLGRPWKAYSTTVYAKSSLAGFIDPAGWMPWTGDSAPDTIFYGEFANFGAGASTKNRVQWKGLRMMDAKQASKFAVGSFVSGNGWIPSTGVPFKSGL